YVSFVVQFAFDFQEAVVSRETQLFQRRIFGRKDILVQDICHRSRADRNLCRADRELERARVVEYGNAVRLCGDESTFQSLDMNYNLWSKVIHNVLHLDLHSFRLEIWGLELS